VAQTEADPPKKGKIILAKSGSTTKRRKALRKTAIAQSQT
jgi:hypothetical protein